MTVGLNASGPRHPWRGPARGVVVQQLGQGDGLLAQLGDVLVVREQLARVGTEDRGAARFQPDDAGTRTQMGSQYGHGPQSGPAWRCRADRWRSRSARSRRAPAGRRRASRRASITSTAARATEGWKELLNVSGHSTTSPRSPVPPGTRSANHCWKLCSANSGAVRCSSMPPARITSRSIPGVCRTAFTALGANGRDRRPQRQPAHRVVGQRAQPGLEVVEQELRLVGRHVDVDRAVGLAALAGQAEVQRVQHLLGAPAVPRWRRPVSCRRASRTAAGPGPGSSAPPPG